ncbi:MAG: hypothetical protein KJO69_06680 [Gammaproteobacteria bacterium]|nr:hypothetical protein [Gammaproteobacteria bacterium]
MTSTNDTPKEGTTTPSYRHEELEIRLPDESIKLLIERYFLMSHMSGESMSKYHDMCETNIQQAVFDAVLNEGILNILKLHMKEMKRQNKKKENNVL